MFHLDGFIEAGNMSIALRRLQQRHPKLQATIVEGSDGRLRYQFQPRVPDIPFEIKDYGETEFAWRQETCQALNEDLPAAGPLARVVVLRSRPRHQCYVLFTVTHAFADGLSALTLMNDLLTEYAAGEAHSEAPAVVPLPLVTALRAKSKGGWRGKVQLLRRFIRLKRSEGKMVQTELPAGRDIPALSQWVHWVFSREDTIR